MFRASLSSIAYIRNLFGEDCFVDGEMGGTRFKRLTKPDMDENKEAAIFMKWLEDGVFDALSKKYLATVMLEIYEDISEQDKKNEAAFSQKKLAETQMACSADPAIKAGKGKRRLLEVFSFGVEYPDGDQSDPRFRLSCAGSGSGTPANTKEGIREAMKKSTSDILRQLVELTQTLQPLPKSRVVSMKLMYTSKTPSSYEPPMYARNFFCMLQAELVCSERVLTTEYVFLWTGFVPQKKIR